MQAIYWIWELFRWYWFIMYFAWLIQIGMWLFLLQLNSLNCSRHWQISCIIILFYFFFCTIFSVKELSPPKLDVMLQLVSHTLGNHPEVFVSSSTATQEQTPALSQIQMSQESQEDKDCFGMRWFFLISAYVKFLFNMLSVHLKKSRSNLKSWGWGWLVACLKGPPIIVYIYIYADGHA